MRVHGPNGSADFLALVDTGADNTILPDSIAQNLGIALTPATGAAATAFGGKQITLSHADIELELVHPDGPLRWLSRVYFVAGSNADDEVLILGHQGFLDYFAATFIGDGCVLELQANVYFPQAHTGN